MNKLKEILHKSFWGRYVLSNLHCLKSWLIPLLISDETAVRKFYKHCTGRELNLENPTGLTEKLNWYKLNARMSLMQTCADKVAVRDYVASKGFKENLNEIYDVCNKVGDLKIESYPERFVIKAAHGSHMNLIVKDKNKVNWFLTKPCLHHQLL